MNIFYLLSIMPLAFLTRVLTTRNRKVVIPTEEDDGIVWNVAIEKRMQATATNTNLHSKER